MAFLRFLLLFSIFFFISTTLGFQCSPDTILRMATDKRGKQIERECHEQNQKQPNCATKDALEKAWKMFEEVSEKYKIAVTKCREYVNEKSQKQSKRSIFKRDIFNHDDGEDQNHDYSQLQRKKRQHRLNSKIQRTIDGIRIKNRRSKNYNFHHQTSQFFDSLNLEDYQLSKIASPHRLHRHRRQLCSAKSNEQLTKMAHHYTNHCERDNICLAMEDLPAGSQRDSFNEIHKLRAKKYTDYLTELFKCYGKL